MIEIGVEVKFVTKVDEVYLCKIRGNKVKVLEAGRGTLVCCGMSMVCRKA